jgi:hypothetical protein
MPELKPGTILPTPEEDAAINAGAAADPDSAEWTDADFAQAVLHEAQKGLGLYILGPERQVIPCDDTITWGREMEKNRPQCRVAETFVGPHRISTVFLWLDYGFGFGPPMLFETMVFTFSRGGDMDRYSTWDEAEAGHARMVAPLLARLQRMAPTGRAAREGRYVGRWYDNHVRSHAPWAGTVKLDRDEARRLFIERWP